jgi:hypothetical protein
MPALSLFVKIRENPFTRLNTCFNNIFNYLESRQTARARYAFSKTNPKTFNKYQNFGSRPAWFIRQGAKVGSPFNRASDIPLDLSSQELAIFQDQERLRPPG